VRIELVDITRDEKANVHKVLFSFRTGVLRRKPR
jgi:hypothetical protein